MDVCFTSRGHPNITATHRTTLEFTTDREVTLNGDCIVGVACDFNLPTIHLFVEDLVKNNHSHFKLHLVVGLLSETFTATVNPGFIDAREIVFRMGDYASKRTLGVRATKSAWMLDRRLVELMKNPQTTMSITLTPEEHDA